MAENSAIEWTDHTFNPWIGCQKVGPGCDHCYAETLMDTRYGKVRWGAGQPRVRTAPANWKKPLQWERGAAAFQAEHGRRQRVFCASLADVFDNAVDPDWRADLFRLIEATPSLDWLLLTKRGGNVPAMLSGRLPANVRIGATMVNQEEWDRDIDKVRKFRNFVSLEPLLGPIDMGGLRVDWVIVGGESGPGARPMHPDWARGLRDQCAAAGVPFLFKQWGEWNPGCVQVPMGTEAVRIEPSGAVHPWPPTFDPKSGDWCMRRVGKKLAGRLLDGVTHDGFPAP